MGFVGGLGVVVQTVVAPDLGYFVESIALAESTE